MAHIMLSTLLVFLLQGITAAVADSAYPAFEPTILNDNSFRTNLETRFSWDDPAVQMALGIETVALSPPPQMEKRVAGTDFDKLYKLPQCAGCPTAPVTYTLADFTTQYFLNYILLSPDQLQNQCVFYGGRKRKPGITPNPIALSKTATRWACRRGRKTIWHLWPSGKATQGGYNNNFYAMEEPGSWLQFINDQGRAATTQFFGHMSEAMALSCRGDVWIMAENVNNLPTEGIWPTIEYPALRRLYAQGLVTSLTAVDWMNPDFIQLSIPLTPLKHKVRDSVEELRSKEDLEARARTSLPISLGRRDSCDATTAYEPDDQDWFG